MWRKISLLDPSVWLCLVRTVRGLYCESERRKIVSLNTVRSENDMGTVYYRLKGRLHREEGPAVVYSTGGDCYYRHGSLHREEGPALSDWMSSQHYERGMRHRDPREGPAVYSSTFPIFEYWVNGLLHREEGPAVMRIDRARHLTYPGYAEKGCKYLIEYYRGGKLHRDPSEGPASHRADLPTEYFAYYWEGKLHRDPNEGPARREGDVSEYYWRGRLIEREVRRE